MEDVDPRVADRVSTTDESGFKIGKALLESSRSAARVFTGTFEEDRKFAIGENQWPVPQSFRAWYRQRWKNESVRNYTLATIHKIQSEILSAKPTIVAEPRDELTTYENRIDIAAAVEHDAQRGRWNQYRRAASFDALVCGKGVVHFYPERCHYQLPDGEVLDLYEIRTEMADLTRYYPQPGTLYQNECDYLTYEPDLSMARIRRMFPDSWQLVNPQTRAIGKLGEVNYSRTQDEIIYGNATGEIAISKEGIMTERYSPVAFTYIKGQEVVAELQSILDRPAKPGLKCTDCGATFGRDQALTDYRTVGAPLCPTCYGSNLTNTMLPPEYVQQMQRQLLYPNGRLICLTKDALLYDGPIEVQLDQVFPFAECNLFEITGRYWGYGMVALLKKVQMALNANASMAINNMRLCGNPPLEVPSEVPAYRHLGNGPGDQIPCPAAFMNLAHYLSPANSYNTTLHQILDNALKRDIQEMAGVNETTRGEQPTAPTSGKEVIALQDAASTRLGLFNAQFNEFESQAHSIRWQMMNQFYTEPRAYQQVKPNGELTSIVLEVNTLPRNARIVVSSSLDQPQKDVNFGQNLMSAVTAGQVGFYPDLMLPLMGAPPAISREIQAREQVRQAQMQAQAAAQLGAVAAGGGDGTGKPPTEALPPGPPAAPSPQPMPLPEAA